MADFDPHLDLLLEVARGLHEPCTADRDRVRSKVAAALSIGAVTTAKPVTDSANSLAASASATTSSVKWIATIALAATLVGAALYYGTGPNASKSPASQPSTAIARPRFDDPVKAVEVATKPVSSTPEPSVPTPAAPNEPTASGAALDSGNGAPSTRRRAPRKQPAVTVAAPSTSPAREDSTAQRLAELALIRDATRALSNSQPAAALSLLERHAVDFPNGLLTQERRGLRVVALCELGRHVEGTRERSSFLERSPNGPLAGRVRAACQPESGGDHDQP